MASAEFIESKLVNRTNAMAAETEAKNNRWHYELFFDESIGFDWFEKQVDKASVETGHNLEAYKFRPAANSLIVAEVREVDRRAEIDESQNSLESFI